MGDGTQPQQPELPGDPPQDVKDFFGCTGDTLVWKKGKVTWLGLPTDPTVSFEHGKTAGTIDVSISFGPGGVIPGFTVPASVNSNGELTIDTSSLPDLSKISEKLNKQKLDDGIKNINDWFKQNGKKLKPAVLKRGELTLTKVTIAADSKTSAPPAPTPTPKAPQPTKGEPGKVPTGDESGSSGPPIGSGMGISGNASIAGDFIGASGMLIDSATRRRDDAQRRYDEAKEWFEQLKAMGDLANQSAVAEAFAAMMQANRKLEEEEHSLYTYTMLASVPGSAEPSAPPAADQSPATSAAPVPQVPVQGTDFVVEPPVVVPQAPAAGAPGVDVHLADSDRDLTARIADQAMHELTPKPFFEAERPVAEAVPTLPVSSEPPSEAVTMGFAHVNYEYAPTAEGVGEKPAQGGGIPIRLVIGGVVVAFILALGGLVLGGNLLSGTNATPAPTTLAASGQPGAGSNGTPAVGPTLPSEAGHPGGVDEIWSHLTSGPMPDSILAIYWKPNPPGGLQDITGQPATITQPYALISGWTFLQDSSVKPGAFTSILGLCGQTAGGVTVICGPNTATAINANPTTAWLALTAFGGPFPSTFPHPSSTTPGSSGSTGSNFFVNAYVDRDSNPANNIPVPSGKPNFGSANADGGYFIVVDPKSGALSLSFNAFAGGAPPPTSAFALVDSQALAYVFLAQPGPLRVTDGLVTFGPSGSQAGIDSWGGLPPTNFTPQRSAWTTLAK